MGNSTHSCHEQWPQTVMQQLGKGWQQVPTCRGGTEVPAGEPHLQAR